MRDFAFVMSAKGSGCSTIPACHVCHVASRADFHNVTVYIPGRPRVLLVLDFTF